MQTTKRHKERLLNFVVLFNHVIMKKEKIMHRNNLSILRLSNQREGRKYDNRELALTILSHS